ncbi:hypothetical protein A2U01_0048930 [Trifolium medium]|uniref:Uncharacterized protein n=1 Tax=Trifolium medium TaxID=97028 RepID=A0A392QVW4_9FABA|nr:hypothetical protein [Trifolium medium]
MAMAMDETRDEILEQQNQLSDFFTREEERLVSEYSEFEKQIKLLKAEVARKKLERELSSKNLELLKATAVSQALHLHSLKIKIQASDERMAQLESKFQDLKANYEKLRKSPPF